MAIDWTFLEPHALYGAAIGAALILYAILTKPTTIILVIAGMIFAGIAVDLFAHEYAH